MIIHKRRKIDFSFTKKTITRLQMKIYFVFLGIIIDEDLTMLNHIEMVTNKLSKITGILK